MGRKRHLKGERPPADPFIEKRAAALWALKDYQRGSFEELHSEVIDVLIDESDRGAVILVGGIVEDVLSEFIIAKLPEGKKRRTDLLRQGGVLNSFQDKVAFGLALGVIDEATADSLGIIRQLRNGCAHSMRRVTLKTPPISQVFSLLLDDGAAKQITEAANDDIVRMILGFVMVFHVERIRGKSIDEAQAIVDKMSANFRKHAAAEKVRLEASPETPSKRPDQVDP